MALPRCAAGAHVQSRSSVKNGARNGSIGEKRRNKWRRKRGDAEESGNRKKKACSARLPASAANSGSNVGEKAAVKWRRREQNGGSNRQNDRRCRSGLGESGGAGKRGVRQTMKNQTNNRPRGIEKIENESVSASGDRRRHGELEGMAAGGVISAAGRLAAMARRMAAAS